MSAFDNTTPVLQNEVEIREYRGALLDIAGYQIFEFSFRANSRKDAEARAMDIKRAWEGFTTSMISFAMDYDGVRGNE